MKTEPKLAFLADNLNSGATSLRHEVSTGTAMRRWRQKRSIFALFFHAAGALATVFCSELFPIVALLL